MKRWRTRVPEGFVGRIMLTVVAVLFVLIYVIMAWGN